MGVKDTSKAVWASGDSYEPFVGRWSRLVAREFVHFALDGSIPLIMGAWVVKGIR